jgi:hypothetical protein
MTGLERDAGAASSQEREWALPWTVFSRQRCSAVGSPFSNYAQRNDNAERGRRGRMKSVRISVYACERS